MLQARIDDVFDRNEPRTSIFYTSKKSTGLSFPRAGVMGDGQVLLEKEPQSLSVASFLPHTCVQSRSLLYIQNTNYFELNQPIMMKYSLALLAYLGTWL
jgi:hypothetical protein